MASAAGAGGGDPDRMDLFVLKSLERVRAQAGFFERDIKDAIDSTTSECCASGQGGGALSGGMGDDSAAPLRLRAPFVAASRRHPIFSSAEAINESIIAQRSKKGTP